MPKAHRGQPTVATLWIELPCIANEPRGDLVFATWHMPLLSRTSEPGVTRATPTAYTPASEMPSLVRIPKRLQPVESAAVHALCSAAVFVAMASAVLVLNGGPSKKLDTGLWVMAFAIALPVGVSLGIRQGRRLAAVPELVARWALALGTLLLMAGLILLRLFGADSAQLAVLGLVAMAASGVTELAVRRRTTFGRLEEWPSWAPIAVGVSAILVMIGLFLVTPGRTFPPLLAVGGALIVVPALTAVALAAVLLLERRTPRTWRRRLLDVGFCLVLVLVVFQVKLPMPAETFIHHHDFYLGPVNDMAHGRTMLVDVWAQYGVGVYYAVLAAFSVLPLNHGGLVLLLSTLMAAEYVLVYATLRTVIRSQALVIAGVVAAVMTNVFASLGTYAVFPSVGPLRFGPPYLIVAAAVAAARWPRSARLMRVAQLVVVAVAAVWSFETFVYTATTWSALAALTAFGRARAGLRMFLGELASAAGVSVASVLALTIGTRAAAGAWPQWSGYFAYVRLYSVDEFGNLPLDFWSPALLMAAAIFLSAVGVVSVARDERVEVSDPVLVAISGFTGFAVSTFTYFLGRSHPNNILNLLVPVCALGCLWASIFLPPRGRRYRPWRLVPVTLMLTVAVSLTLLGVPFAAQKWHLTAFAHAVPFADASLPGHGGLSLRASIEELWAGRTYDDSTVDSGAKLLQRYDPGKGPALVLAPQATEILLKVRRVNLLPISNPEEDTLVISRVWPRVVAAIDAVPDGTILLASSIQPQTVPPILQRALGELQRRFDFQVLESAPSGFQVIRLHRARPQAG